MPVLQRLIKIREEDVSQTMYKDTSRSLASEAASMQQGGNASGSKVDKVCDAFLAALKNRTSTHFQNVVTAHVCKIPPDLDAGLSQIAGLRSESPIYLYSAAC